MNSPLDVGPELSIVIHPVRLQMLNIFDFKQLNNATINLNSPEKLCLIGVEFSYEKSMLMEAIEFGLAGETNIQNANVAVTFRRRNYVKTFRHQKMNGLSLYYTHNEHENENAEVQVSRNIFLADLLEFDVNGRDPSFLISAESLDSLATNQIDIRPHLEKALVPKTRPLNARRANNNDDDDDAEHLQTKQQREFKLKQLSQVNESFLGICQRFQRVHVLSSELQLSDVDRCTFDLAELCFHRSKIDRSMDTDGAQEDLIEFMFDSASDYLDGGTVKISAFCGKSNSRNIAIYTYLRDGADVDHKQLIITYLNQIRQTQRAAQEQYQQDLTLANMTSNVFDAFIEEFENAFFGVHSEAITAVARFENAVTEFECGGIKSSINQTLKHLKSNLEIVTNTFDSLTMRQRQIDTQLEQNENEFDEGEWFESTVDGPSFVPNIGLNLHGIQPNQLNCVPHKKTHQLPAEDDLNELVCYENAHASVDPSHHTEALAEYRPRQKYVNYVENVDSHLARVQLKPLFGFQEYLSHEADQYRSLVNHLRDLIAINERETAEMVKKIIKLPNEIKNLTKDDMLGTLLQFENQSHFAEQVIAHYVTRRDHPDAPIPLINGYNYEQIDNLMEELRLDDRLSQGATNAFNTMIDGQVEVLQLLDDLLLDLKGQISTNIHEAAVEGHRRIISVIRTELRINRNIVFDGEPSPRVYYDRIRNRNLIDFNNISNLFGNVQHLIVQNEWSKNLYFNVDGLRDIFERKRDKQKKKLKRKQKNYRTRARDFQEKFDEFQINFEQHSKHTRHWRPNQELCCTWPAFDAPIYSYVVEFERYLMATHASTLSSPRKALRLKMIINETLRSPVLILDTLDYILDADQRYQLISYIKRLMNYRDCQVLLMFVKSPPNVPGNESFLMMGLNEDAITLSNITELV